MIFHRNAHVEMNLLHNVEQVELAQVEGGVWSGRPDPHTDINGNPYPEGMFCETGKAVWNDWLRSGGRTWLPPLSR